MKSSLWKVRNLAVIGLTVGVVAACGSVSSVSSITNEYSDYELYRYAASDGVVHVAVVGQTSTLTASALNQVVVDQFETIQIGPVANYSTDPATIDNGDVRFVVAFNPGSDVGISNICSVEASTVGAAEAGEPLRAIGAFCRGDDARTWSITTVKEDSPSVEVAEVSKSLAQSVFPRPVQQPRCDADNC